MTGFAAVGDQVTFSVNVDTAGTYKLYIGAAAGTDGAGLSVQVNGADAVDKNVANFNANASGSICPDNWAGYEMEISLEQGENTIVIGKSASLAAADLDYIELLLLKAAQQPEMPDKSELQDAVDNAVQLVQEDYTAESWENFQEALKNAQSVLADDSADQEAVDAALDALKQAVNNLVKTETDSGNGDSNNGNTGNGDATAPPDTSNSNGNSPADKAAKTGDDASVLPATAALVLSLTVVGVILYRKKRKQS